MPKRVFSDQVLLSFEKNVKVREDLSAIAQTPGGYLWIGSDELNTLDRLSPVGDSAYGNHRQYRVSDYIDLPDQRSEIDIEGMDFSDGYLWLVGSHSTRRKGVKGKDEKKNIQRLLEIAVDLNRYVLARIPLVDGEPVKVDEATGRSAACLEKGARKSVLIDVLIEDDHLGPFLKMGLPSKDNGLDIEAIALKENRVFLGLRGPVLRGIAIVLELSLKEAKPGILKLKKLKTGKHYRKCFAALNGLGVRDLCFRGEDLIVLAGPTMTINGNTQLFSLKNVLKHEHDALFTQERDNVVPLFSLAPEATENAEGITLLSMDSTDSRGEQGRDKASENLLIIYDSPDASRLSGEHAIFADVFQVEK